MFDMKRSIKAFIFILSCLILRGEAWAIDIQTLLEAVDRQPALEVRTLSIEESALQQESAAALLFPKIGAFGRAEIYNSPTNLRPMAPTEVNIQAGDAIPFSREILRYGLTLEVPVFVKEIYVLRQKAAALNAKAQLDRRLDLIGRQSAVVVLNSTLAYFERLAESIGGRRKSLEQTRDDIVLKVRKGRLAGSELTKIETTINDLDLQANDLQAKRLDVLREINALTGIELAGSASMSLTSKPSPSPFLQVQAQQKQVAAAQKELDRRRATRYPTLSFNSYVSGNDGEAYNTDSHIYRSYNAAALVLKLPLFDRSLATDEAIASVQWQKAKKQLAQTQIEAQALANSLDRKLPVVERSVDIADKSIINNKTLLAVATVAIRSGRMTMEDYLRYESNLLAAQANLYQSRQQRWQILAQQAALYGTDLKGVVK